MNEQINYLLDQAKLTPVQEMFESELQKFADLLVCECSGVIQDFVTLRVPASQYPSMLKKYFGVEQ